MAEKKICDRPHHVEIPAGNGFYLLNFKTPEGEQKIDLCEACGLDFKAFMATMTPAAPAAPSQPSQNQNATPADNQQPAA